MVFRYLNRPVGVGARAFDADVLLWRDQVVTNGGSVSLARLIIVDQFVYSEKAAGIWTLTDDYWGLFAESAIQGLTSLKQRRLAVAVNTPTFTTDRGYATNGTSSYIDLGFVPSTNGIATTTTSNHAEIYERANVAGAFISLGCTSNSNRQLAIQTRNGANALGAANDATATYTLPSATSLGLTQWGRNGALTTATYGAKNGVDMVRTVAASAVGASLPACAIFVGAFNNNGGGSALWKASSYGYAAIGGALSSAQRLARYNNVQAWATSVGANV